MAFSKRTPPVKILVDINKFNLLVQTISNYMLIEDDKIKNTASKLKEKIMRYSVPYENEEQEKMIDIRFFISEIEDLTNIFLFGINSLKIESDYYNELIKNRKLVSNEKNNGKGEVKIC